MGIIFRRIKWVVFACLSVMCLHADNENDALTHVETLDLSGWMQMGYVPDQRVFGEWMAGEMEPIHVSKSPFGGNAVFVKFCGRIIPGFLADWKGEVLLIAGTNASETLQLMPQVFLLEFSGETHKKELNRLHLRSDFPEGLKKLSELLEVLDMTT